jgi:hypothetical protein
MHGINKRFICSPLFFFFKFCVFSALFFLLLNLFSLFFRPVVIGDKIEIRPMMYLALTYDHRLVDGREGVTFLRRIKDLVEDPTRIVLDV